MTDILTPYLFPAVAGFALGLMFFGGLWWTVQRVITSRAPALLLAGSWLLRMGILMAGLWLTTAGQWQRVIVCLAGILLARFVLTQRLKPLLAPPPGGPGR